MNQSIPDNNGGETNTSRVVARADATAWKTDLEMAMAASLANTEAAQRLQRIQLLLNTQYDKTIFKVDGFGDCQFMALSHQLYGTPDHHQIIREKCTDYIADHSNDFFFEGGDSFVLSSYLANMRRTARLHNGSYGDEHTLAAFSILSKRTVYCFSSDHDLSIRCYCVAGDSSVLPNDPSVLYLFFDPVLLHYDSVVPSTWCPPVRTIPLESWCQAGVIASITPSSASNHIDLSDDLEPDTNPDADRAVDLDSISRFCGNNFSRELTTFGVELVLLWLDNIVTQREGRTRKTFFLTVPFSTQFQLDNVLRGIFGTRRSRVQYDPTCAETFYAVAIQHRHFWAYEVNIKSGRILLYDSLSHSNTHPTETRELCQSLQKYFPAAIFLPVSVQITSLQNNGIDCGVFACEVLRRKVSGEDTLAFSHVNIRAIRKNFETTLLHRLAPSATIPTARLQQSPIINLVDDVTVGPTPVNLSSNSEASALLGSDPEIHLGSTTTESECILNDIFTPTDVIDGFLSVVRSTLNHCANNSGVQWLVLPTNAHLGFDSHPSFFSQWACHFDVSFDRVCNILIPISTSHQGVILANIDVRKHDIHVTQFVRTAERPVSAVLLLLGLLRRDYGTQEFQTSFTTSYDPSRTDTSSGTAACALVLQLLAPRDPTRTLQDSVHEITRATNRGIVESILPKDPSSNPPSELNATSRREAAANQALFDKACAAQTNAAELEKNFQALYEVGLTVRKGIAEGYPLIRALSIPFYGDDTCTELALRAATRELTAEGLELNSSNVITHFCCSNYCRVILYELVDGTLSKALFQPSPSRSEVPDEFCILRCPDEQYFPLEAWTPSTFSEAVTGLTPRLVPQASLPLASLRRRSDERRAERRMRTPQIVKFLSPRPTKPLPESIPSEYSQLTDLVVAVQNTNSYTTTPVGLEAWAQFIQHYLPDIAINVDARATVTNARMYEDSLRLHLKGYYVSVVPTAVEKIRTVHDDVGSIIITISPRLSSHVDRTFRDPLGLGVVAGVLIKTSAMNILVLGVYWMTKPTGAEAENKNSLWMRAERRIKQAKLNLSPLKYVKSASEDLLTLARRNNWRVIYAGDLNSGYNTDEGQHRDCEPWASKFDLRNLPLEYVQRNKLAPIVTRFASDGTGRAIDHILTDLPSRCDCVVNPRLKPTLAETLSDHLPLIITLRHLNLKVKPEYVPTPPRPVDLDRKNKLMVGMFQSSVTEFHGTFTTSRPDDPGRAACEYIESICEFAVQDVSDLIGKQNLKTPHKIKYFHGWSPVYMLHCYHLSFLYRLRRLVEMEGETRLRIPGYDLKQSIRRISENLMRARDRLNEKSPPGSRSTPLDLILRDSMGRTFTHDVWLNLPTDQIIPTILSVIPKLKKCMHARKRAQDRELISAFVKRNEQRRKDRQFKKLFSAIFNRYRREIDQIVDPKTGQITSDPIELHDVITSHLSGWHRLNQSDPSIEWRRAVVDQEYLLSVPSLQHLPQSLLRKLAKSFTKHSRNRELRSAMDKALNQEISFEEYMGEVRSKANNKSPGLSGFTINMLKEFPDEVQRHLHLGLCEIWSRRNEPDMVPESWYARWICSVPKKKNGPITLDSIRPISLYEVLRKVWTSIITARISKVWTEHKALHPTQYGYQFAMGTDTELIQVINVVEDAAEFQKRLILTSFDTTKAFDSVNKPLMVAAWTRLGVPPDIADYLVNMDIGGDTLVKTAHAKSVIGKLGKGKHLRDVRISGENIKSTCDSVQTFTARDGIGQGDSPSANAWIAIYDILLCALDEIEEDPYRFQKRDGEISTCAAAAYADDLQTFSPTVEHAQAAIDLVSAFNCVTGFTTNITKMKCGTNLNTDLGQVLVHDRHWIPHSLTIDPELEVEILGVTVDLTNRWRTLRREIAEKTAEISLPLSRKRLSIESKRIAYEMVVLPTILYKAKFINLSLDEYESLLKPVNALLRSINRLKRSSPEQVLYTDHKTAGGLQLSNIVSRVQDFKSGMFARAMRDNNPARHAATAIIERCFRQQAINYSGNASITISEHNCSWYSSLLERQTSSGTRLYRTSGPSSNYASHQPIRELCHPEHIDQCDALLAQLDITIVRDLTAEIRGQPFRRWFTDHPVVSMLARFPLIPNDEPNILQIGKLYLCNSNNTKTIQEFCGWEATTLYFREWKAGPGKCPAVGDAISLVAEPQHWTKHTDTFCQNLIAHVYALGRVNKKGAVTSTKIWAIQPDLIPVRMPPTVLLPPPCTIPSVSFQSPYRLFTDGAHRKLLSAQQIIFGILPCDLSSQSVLNSSGGVIYKDRYPVQLITVTGFDRQVIPNSSSYESEAIGLLAGLSTLGERALKVTAYTDSKALLGKLRQYRIKCSSEYSADPLITKLHCLVSQFHVNLQWVKGHPEKRAEHKRKDWTEQDIGIYIADQMTFGGVDDLAPLRFHCDNIEPTIIQFCDLVPSLHCTRYQYRRKDDVPLAEYQMRLLHQQKTAEEYLQHREHASSTNARNRNILWTQLSIPLSVQALEYNRYISKTRVAKTIFDLYDDDLHKAGDHVQFCPLCRVCEDTTEHLFSCCDPIATSMVQFALIEQQKLPVPQELYECVTIEEDHIAAFRQFLISTINLDAQTRIGLFNRDQQKSITEEIPGLYIRDDSKELFGAISRYIVRLLQPTISATLGLILLRNNKKKELERLRLQSDETKTAQEKKRRVYESSNPFSILLPSDSADIIPIPVISYEICYGYPSVTTQIVARTPEEAVNTIAQLIQTPVDFIDFYHRSNEHSGVFVHSKDLSPSTMNFISRGNSIFSPAQFFPLSDDPELADISRYRAIQEPHLSCSDSIVFAKFLVQLERLIAMNLHSRFFSFLQQCNCHVEAASNRNALYDIQTDIHTLQTSSIHKKWLTCEQLHLFLMWSPEVICLRRIFQYSVSVGINYDLDNCQQYATDNSDHSLPRMLSDQIVVYRRTTSDVTIRRLPRLCKIERKVRQKPIKNTFEQCQIFHKEGKHAHRISSFPTIPTVSSSSSPEALNSLQNEIKILFLRYALVAGQKVDVRDTGMCQQISSDTESLITDERILSLSTIHRRYLRDRLRRAITQIQSIQQETAAYDHPPNTIRLSNVSSILPFLTHRPRLDNKDPPD